jgi:hypothetical protein
MPLADTRQLFDDCDAIRRDYGRDHDRTIDTHYALIRALSDIAIGFTTLDGQPGAKRVTNRAQHAIGCLRRIAQDIKKAQQGPCAACGGARWVDDENWEPDYPEERRGQLDRKGTYVGLLPCPECNWDRHHATVEDVTAGGGDNA